MIQVMTTLVSWFVMVALAGPVSAQTVLTDVWKDKEYAGRPKKIAVFWIDQVKERRILIEDEFIRQLKARGTNAMPMYVVIQPNKIVEKEDALKKLRDLGADAIISVRLVDKLTAETRIPDPSRKDPAGASAWSGYYHYAYDPVSRGPDEPAYIETTMFDAASEKRVWIARSVSKIEVASPDVVSPVIKALIDRLSADTLIK